MPIMTDKITARTQKARSIQVLKEYGFAVPTFRLYDIATFRDVITPKSSDPWAILRPQYGSVVIAYQNLIGSFVRPCPLTPRHGFVDSRVVSDLAEAKAIVDETRKADPQSEILAMAPLKATHSAIWTEGQLSIGKGNDGATAGTSAKLIPTLGDPLVRYENDSTSTEVKNAAGITDSPYVELVWKFGTSFFPYFVQLRNGPKLPSTLDYIPKAFTVQHVIRPEGSLLEWETKCKAFQPGTVVYHPNDPAKSSHYSVHCVTHQIPLIISREPKVGDRLVPSDTTRRTTVDTLKIKQGFFIGASIECEMSEAARLMLVGCHSAASWVGTHDILLGAALGCAYRLIIVECLGEARHNPNHKRKLKRDHVYEKAWGRVLTSPSTRQAFCTALKMFTDRHWESGYGGPRWFEVGAHACMIFNALLDNDPTLALEHLNQTINLVHNGGWAFNKVLEKSEMDVCAKNPAKILLGCAPLAYRILEAEQADWRDWFKYREHFHLDKLDKRLPQSGGTK